MTEKEFDDIFRSLEGYTETPSEDTWKGIEKKMARRRNFVLLKWVGTVGAAAALTLGLLLTNPSGVQEHSGIKVIPAEEYVPGNEFSPGEPSRPTAAIAKPETWICSPGISYLPELKISGARRTAATFRDGQDKEAPELKEKTEDFKWDDDRLFDNTPYRETKKYSAAVLDMSTTTHAGTFANGIVSPSEMRHIKKMNAFKVDPGINKRDTVIERKSGSYSVPVSLGVGAKIRLSDKFDIGIGVNYTVMSRKLAGEFNGNYYSEIRNIQQYIGIPVNIYYNVIKSDRVSVYIQAGGTVERGIGDLYKMNSANGSVLTHNETIKGVQLSVGAGIGIEYWFNDFTGIFFDPTIRYYFDNYQAKSIRTDQPLQTGFELGVRFRL